MLERFEADLAEHRRRLAGAEQKPPAYRGYRGEAFAFEELCEKEDELHAVEQAVASKDRFGEENDVAINHIGTA